MSNFCDLLPRESVSDAGRSSKQVLDEGHVLGSLHVQFKCIDAAVPVQGGVATSVVRSYLGLLAQGKSDFDAIEHYREDTFFKRTLGAAKVPPSPTLRQRPSNRSL